MRPDRDHAMTASEFETIVTRWVVWGVIGYGIAYAIKSTIGFDTLFWIFVGGLALVIVCKLAWLVCGGVWDLAAECWRGLVASIKAHPTGFAVIVAVLLASTVAGYLIGGKDWQAVPIGITGLTWLVLACLYERKARRNAS